MQDTKGAAMSETKETVDSLFLSKKVDWQFILDNEGNWQTGYVPNSPGKGGALFSGVTILFGFDLGQQNAATINHLPISKELKEKLLPYVGKKGASAVMALQNRLERSLNVLATLNSSPGSRVGITPPLGVIGNKSKPIRDAGKNEKPTQFIAQRDSSFGLELTPEEVNQLSPAVKALYYKRLASAFNSASKGRHFSTLPTQAQTGLISLHWHCGNIWATKAGNPRRQIFDAAINDDWADVVDTLKAEPFPRLADRRRRLAEARLFAKAFNIDFNNVGPKEKAYLEKLAAAKNRSNTAPNVPKNEPSKQGVPQHINFPQSRTISVPRKG
jgi:hypothetical protein